MTEEVNDFGKFVLHGEEMLEDDMILISDDIFIDVIYDKFKDRYEVNKKGEVRNKKTGRILKPCIVGGNADNPYMNVTLCNNREQQTMRQHKVVADAWLERSICDGNEVNHLDNNPANNSIENLQRCDKYFNLKDSYYKNHAPVLQFSSDSGHFLAFYPALDCVVGAGYDKDQVKECCLDQIESYKNSNWLYLKDLKEVYPSLNAIDIRKNRPLERMYFTEGFNKFYHIIEKTKLYSLLSMCGATQEELLEITGWDDEMMRQHPIKLDKKIQDHIKNSNFLSKHYNKDGTPKQ